jgi:diguanylate cyclase (GGDEF)-like protein
VISIFGEFVMLAAVPGIVAGRIGGEEFAILIPAAEMGAARSFAERLRDGFGKHCKGRLPAGLRPSISIGIHVSRAGIGLYDLLSNADAALYEAKRSGRDRVNVFVPEIALVPELALMAEGRTQIAS